MRRRELKKVYPLLRVLSRLDASEKKILFRFLTSEGCTGVYECVYNGLYNATLPHECRTRLCCDVRKYKRELRLLAGNGTDMVKKKVLLQKMYEPVHTIMTAVFPLLEDEMKKEVIVPEKKKKKRRVRT